MILVLLLLGFFLFVCLCVGVFFSGVGAKLHGTGRDVRCSNDWSPSRVCSELATIAEAGIANGELKSTTFLCC